MLHFSQYVIVRETLVMAAGILDMAAIGDAEAPADPAFNLKGALQPAVRDDDVEYEGMCRCLVEMLLKRDGMFWDSTVSTATLHRWNSTGGADGLPTRRRSWWMTTPTWRCSACAARS